jgi:hypothetical protein
MRPTRGSTAARRCPGEPGHALLLGLAPGRACRVSPRHRSPGDGLVSVALVLASRRTGVTRYPAPGSPDVPHAGSSPPARDRPAASLADAVYPAAWERGLTASDVRAASRPFREHDRGSSRHAGRHGTQAVTGPRAPARPMRPRRRRAGARRAQRGRARGPGGSRYARRGRSAAMTSRASATVWWVGWGWSRRAEITSTSRSRRSARPSGSIRWTSEQ